MALLSPHKEFGCYCMGIAECFFESSDIFLLNLRIIHLMLLFLSYNAFVAFDWSLFGSWVTLGTGTVSSQSFHHVEYEFSEVINTSFP